MRQVTTVRGFAFGALVLLLAAFAPAPVHAHDGEHMTAAEAAERDIRQADIDFCAAVAAHDTDRFRTFIGQRAKFFGGDVSIGPDEVSKGWAPFLDPESKLTLTWAPKEVVVAASADLGYSIGEFDFRSPDKEGTITSKRGYYVTIWRKDEDGRWRANVDIGTPPGVVDMTKQIFAE